MNVAESYSLSEQEQVRISNAQRLTEGGEDSVSTLISMLTDPSWVVRREVVLALSRLGLSAAEALCRVLETMRDHEARIAAAVDALVASTSSVEAMVLELGKSEDPAIVADVVQILGRRRDPKVVPELIRFTKHRDDNVAVGALEALGRIGGRAAVEALIETTQSGNFFRTFPAIDVLGRSGDPRVVAPLTALLSVPSYLPEAARALGRCGEKAAVEPLVRLLVSNSESVVRVVTFALSDLRDRAEEKAAGSGIAIDTSIRDALGIDAIRKLIRFFPHTDGAESVAFCKVLGTTGSPEAAEVLTTALDSAPVVARAAADGLRRIGRDADEHLLLAIREGGSDRRKVLLPLVTRTTAVLDVANCLVDGDADVRALACDTLARIGNGSVVGNVFRLLADPNPRVVHSATAAIQALGTRDARRLAVEAASSPSPLIRRSALRILGYFGDADSLGVMLAGLKDEDARVREAALQGLPYLEDSRAIEALIEESKSSDARMRGLALRSLGQVPKASERIYSLMLGALRDGDSWVRYYACQSLGRLGYTPAATEITKLLQDSAGQVRVSAVEALSHLQSGEAHEALRDATLLEDIDVRRAALVGLGIAHRSEDLPLILSALGSSDVPTRLISLSALVNFHSPLVLSALSSAGSDADEQIRSAALGLLAARPEEEATDVLIHLLSKEGTREAARAALLVPNPGRVGSILTALHTSGDDLAPVLMSLLTRMDRPDARNAVLAAMKLTNLPARKAAAAALSPNRNVEMKTALQDAAENDPSEEVRKIATLRLRD